jgi:hypothetical protein
VGSNKTTVPPHGNTMAPIHTCAGSWRVAQGARGGNKKQYRPMITPLRHHHLPRLHSETTDYSHDPQFHLPPSSTFRAQQRHQVPGFPPFLSRGSTFPPCLLRDSSFGQGVGDPAGAGLRSFGLRLLPLAITAPWFTTPGTATNLVGAVYLSPEMVPP